MSDNLCVRCGRPTADGFACSDCAHRAGNQLHETADMTQAARDIATGLARHGHSGSSGTESRIPLNLGATQRLNAVEGSQGGWARVISHERGVPTPDTRAKDPIVAIAEFLAGHVEWVRHKQFADEFLTDVDACARVVRGIARGPSEQKYLGPCGADILACVVCQIARPDHHADCDSECPHRLELPDTCDGDVYAYRGARTGRCKTCGGEVATSEREAWLDGEVRGHAFTAKDIADAHGLNVKTIRSWANRDQLKTYWRTDAGLVTPWIEPTIDPDLKDDALAAREAEIEAELEVRGPRLHYVGDVLDLAAADAARRATEQSKRARRREQRDQGDAA